MEKIKVPKFPRVLLNRSVEEIDRQLQEQTDALAPFRYDGPVGTTIGWKINEFTIPANSLYMLRLVRDGGRGSAPGKYHRLLRTDNTGTATALVMSDTNAEMIDFLRDMGSARGHVLVGGLGMGLALKAMMLIGKVKQITVIELSASLIHFLKPYIFGMAQRYGVAVQLVQGDVLKWQPQGTMKYDWMWFDIWDEISADNIPDMDALQVKYAPYLKPNGKMRFWVEKECRLLEEGVDPRHFYRR